MDLNTRKVKAKDSWKYTVQLKQRKIIFYVGRLLIKRASLFIRASTRSCGCGGIKYSSR